MSKSVCFFLKLKDKRALETIEYYAQDMQILRELGYDVRLIMRVRDLRPADIYFVWWWTWAFVPLALAKTLGRPCLITGVFDLWAYPGRPLIQRLLLRLGLRSGDANIFISSDEYHSVPMQFFVRNPQLSHLVINTERYLPPASAAGRENFLLSVAWLKQGNAHRKCIPETIEAFRIVAQHQPELKLKLAGEIPPGETWVEELIASCGLAGRVELLGSVSVEEKISLMQRCKIYLQPSRFEGFGLAVLEALSCGCAVVTSPVGAVPEVVGDAAVCVDGTKPEAIAQAILELLGDDSRRQQLGRAARERAVRLFSYERRKREIRTIIEAALAGRSQAAVCHDSSASP